MGSNGAWTVNETEMSIFSKIKTLKIHKADPTNMGIFVCRASNSIGNAEREVQLYRKYIQIFRDLASFPLGVEKGTSLPPVLMVGTNKHS